jgi:predicted nicotinamide N-methyase
VTARERHLYRRKELVARRTRLRRPPAVPELVLHLADDMTETWQDLQRELDQGEIDPPFWAFAWLGGQALARYVLDHPAEVAGRSVLDLASGSGLVALAARRAGAASVLAVDIDPLAEAAVALNARANDLDVAVTVADLLDDPPPPVDLVLAGDVLYDPDMAARVLPWLEAAGDQGSRVLLGDPGRSYLPPGLPQLAEVEIETTRDLEGVERKLVRVYELRAGRTPLL